MSPFSVPVVVQYRQAVWAWSEVGDGQAGPAGVRCWRAGQVGKSAVGTSELGVATGRERLDMPAFGSFAVLVLPYGECLYKEFKEHVDTWHTNTRV